MIIFVFFPLPDLDMNLTTFPKRVFFQHVATKMITITYLYHFLTLLEPSGSFFILDSRHPEIQKCPGIGYFGPISRYGAFFPLNFCQGTWFSMQNLKIKSFLETSRNVLELWILPLETSRNDVIFKFWKSSSLTKMKWKIYPMYWNQSKLANSRAISRVPGNFWKFPGLM